MHLKFQQLRAIYTIYFDTFNILIF